MCIFLFMYIYINTYTIYSIFSISFIFSKIKTLHRRFSCTPNHKILGYVIHDDKDNTNNDKKKKDENTHINNEDQENQKSKNTVFKIGYNDNKITYDSDNTIIQFPVPFKVPPDPYVFDYGQG
jgi:hypothetical protein